MEQYRTGDVIEHKHLPGFEMTIHDTAPCPGQTDARPHLAYKITDPDGCQDWLCAHDVTQKRP